MPVPRVAPMLIIVSCHMVSERRSVPPSPWPPSETSCSTGLRRSSGFTGLRFSSESGGAWP